MKSTDRATPSGVLEYVQLAGVLLAVLALRELGTSPEWTAEALWLLAATAVGAAAVFAVWAWRRRRILPATPALRLADTPERPRPRRRAGLDTTRRRQRRTRLSPFAPESESSPRGQAGPPSGDATRSMKSGTR